MREGFLQQLEEVKNQLYTMSRFVERAISNSIKAITTSDKSYCETVYKLEIEINHYEKLIDKLCAEILIMQQPVATDFSIVYTTQKIIVDLERMGDNAEDIAKITEKISEKKIKDYVLIPRMAEETIRLVKGGLEAYMNQDYEAAVQIRNGDDEVDDLFNEVKKEISKIILENPQSIDTALDILMIAKYFEKIADHAVNIAEHIIVN
ncbi:MAG: phosphate signaling complex protein PhoU [Bacillota bacterium]|nr:phosphate signaling complex protein PhoU [Bacillota bacterium]